jgi:hypothetical protein
MGATKTQITVWNCKCDRDKCGNEWTTRTTDLPQICPKCKTRNWNKEPKERADLERLKEKYE